MNSGTLNTNQGEIASNLVMNYFLGEVETILDCLNIGSEDICQITFADSPEFILIQSDSFAEVDNLTLHTFDRSNKIRVYIPSSVVNTLLINSSDPLKEATIHKWTVKFVNPFIDMCLGYMESSGYYYFTYVLSCEKYEKIRKNESEELKKVNYKELPFIENSSSLEDLGNCLTKLRILDFLKQKIPDQIGEEKSTFNLEEFLNENEYLILSAEPFKRRLKNTTRDYLTHDVENKHFFLKDDYIFFTKEALINQGDYNYVKCELVKEEERRNNNLEFNNNNFSQNNFNNLKINSNFSTNYNSIKNEFSNISSKEVKVQFTQNEKNVSIKSQSNTITKEENTNHIKKENDFFPDQRSNINSNIKTEMIKFESNCNSPQEQNFLPPCHINDNYDNNRIIKTENPVHNTQSNQSFNQMNNTQQNPPRQKTNSNLSSAIKIESQNDIFVNSGYKSAFSYDDNKSFIHNSNDTNKFMTLSQILNSGNKNNQNLNNISNSNSQLNVNNQSGENLVNSALIGSNQSENSDYSHSQLHEICEDLFNQEEQEKEVNKREADNNNLQNNIVQSNNNKEQIAPIEVNQENNEDDIQSQTPDGFGVKNNLLEEIFNISFGDHINERDEQSNSLSHERENNNLNTNLLDINNLSFGNREENKDNSEDIIKENSEKLTPFQRKCIEDKAFSTQAQELKKLNPKASLSDHLQIYELLRQAQMEEKSIKNMKFNN